MFFSPTPYKDELLYSVLARFCIQSGNVSVISNFDDLFGTRNILASVELPGNLNKLISNMPVNSKYSSDYFILNNTLFPYIAAFLPEERAREIRGIMKEGKASTVYNKSGYISSDIIQNNKFKYCPECVKEDVNNNSETYYRRLHQITGVLVCPIHLEPLLEGNVYMRGANRQSYMPATPDNCITENTPLYSTDTIKKLLWIAEDVQTILNRKFIFQSIENQKFLYMEKLIEKHFANLNSMVHQKKLRMALLEFWGEDLLRLLQSPISVELDCLWLSKLVRENDITSQPLRNLIFARFLGIDICELLDYQRDMNNIKSHKQIWEEKLIELVDKKISLREMARELDSTPKTVKNCIEKLGIERFWTDNGGRRYLYAAYKDTQEFKYRKEKAREDWVILRKKNPNLSRNKLGKLDLTLYTRLTRYDKLWLDEHSPKIRSYNLTNWDEKDFELLPRVKEVVEEMLVKKPEMIRLSSIGGKLGIGGWFVKRKDKMPMVKAYLESKVETLKDFHLRKIKWAIIELENEYKTITKWNLLEKSGVKLRYIEEISEEIREILKEKGYDENLLY